MPRPAGVPAEQRPPQRLGQHARARAGRHRPRHPRPARRLDRARRRRQPDRHPARGRRDAGAPSVDTSQEEKRAALRDAQAYLHSWGIVGWQDALVGGYADLDDPTQAYLDLVGSGDLTARVRLALCWDPHRGVEQVDDLRCRARAARRGGPRRGLGQADGRRCLGDLHDGRRRALPGRSALPVPRAASGGSSSCRRTSSTRPWSPSTRPDSRPTSTRWGTARYAPRSTPSPPRGARNGWSPQRHQLAHLQLVDPGTAPASGTSARSRTSRGCGRATTPRPCRWSSPTSTRSAWTGSTPSATSSAAAPWWPGARTGRSTRRSRWRASTCS